jgi:predicted transcriptional regulator
MRKTTRRSAVVAGTVVGLVGTGIAFAAWTNSGEASGTVTAETAKPLTVTVTNVSGLFPTGSVDVPFTVTNTNPYEVTLDNATLKSVTVDAGHSACNPTVVTGADVAVTDVIAPAGISATRNFPVTMSNAAVDACQGAVFTVTLKVTGLSS